MEEERHTSYSVDDRYCEEGKAVNLERRRRFHDQAYRLLETRGYTEKGRRETFMWCAIYEFSPGRDHILYTIIIFKSELEVTSKNSSHNYQEEGLVN